MPDAGNRKDLGVTDAFDPEQNIMGGSKYIADLLKRYDGDTKLALALIMRNGKCEKIRWNSSV